MTCFRCARNGEKICDGLCPFGNDTVCSDCPRKTVVQSEKTVDFAAHVSYAKHSFTLFE